MSRSAKPVFEFGPFRLDPGEQGLFLKGELVPLTPKAFELLVCLVENRGRLLRKEELLASVWPGTFVEEAVLSVNISAIRKALGDDRSGHAFIETVPRCGYRFVAAVSASEAAATDSWPSGGEVAAVGPEPGSSGSESTPARNRRRLVWIAASTALALVVLAVQIRWGLWPRSVRGYAVAVLPLQSLSGGREQEQFADAMTDMLITELGQIQALRVVSRQSVIQYKQSRKSLLQIARELKVDYLTEGTVSRDGQRVRMTAQLIHGSTDRHLWARSYERDLPGAFTLQREVAESIAREIGVKLSPAPAGNRTDAHVPAEAYEAYLRGNYLLDSGESLAAIEQFRQATAAYPNFAAPYARIATAYFNLAYFGAMAPKEAYPGMKEAALKALERDDHMAEAHAALAVVEMHYDWDWPGAEREFRRALELNPSDSDVRHMYAHYLLTVGQSGESLTQMNRAFEIDPVGVGTAT